MATDDTASNERPSKEAYIVNRSEVIAQALRAQRGSGGLDYETMYNLTESMRSLLTEMDAHVLDLMDTQTFFTDVHDAQDSARRRNNKVWETVLMPRRGVFYIVVDGPEHNWAVMAYADAKAAGHILEGQPYELLF